MTSGLGAIGNAPIHSLAKDLRREFKTDGSKYQLNPDKYSVAEVAEKAHDFLFTDKYSAASKIEGDHSLDFWIGGYSSDSDTHELFKVGIVNGAATVECLCRDGQSDLFWGGQPSAINRLVMGYDNTLVESLRKVGVSDATFRA